MRSPRFKGSAAQQLRDALRRARNCRWSVNNCGPNDEPFAFHAGGVNATMGDGSVSFLADSVDGVVVKWMVGAEDGETINDNL